MVLIEKWSKIKNNYTDGYHHIKWITLTANKSITFDNNGESLILASRLRENEEIDTES